ncbi:MAG: acyl-CoA dehydrogenase family protein [Nitrospirae bacterium]|nr:acyl-CoA dehydrogenase family protein [Nitrospirota bacterium]
MDFTFTDEQRMLREMVKGFTDKEVKPLAHKIDKEKHVPAEMIDQAASLGFFGIPFPEKYGGSGAGETGYCIMLEELSRGCSSTAVTIGAHIGLAMMSIYLGGNEEQRQTFLPVMAQGKKLGAFALTEPQAGSDAAHIQTSAVRDGDYFVINGSKIWITNGNFADIIVIFAVTDKSLGAKGGITGFIVDKETPGFIVGKVDDKMGIRGSSSTELIFQEMRVPKERVLGEIGKGFQAAMKTLDLGRVSLSAGSLGASKEMLDLSLEFSKKRVQFGQPIASFEAIQWMLAEMAAEIYQMESVVYRTAWMYDQGMRFSRESAICKMFASEALCRIVDKALQIHGGMGYMSEYPIERFYRDARINRIFEGTNEIQRLIIAEDLLKRGG